MLLLSLWMCTESKCDANCCSPPTGHSAMLDITQEWEHICSQSRCHKHIHSSQWKLVFFSHHQKQEICWQTICDHRFCPVKSSLTTSKLHFPALQSWLGHVSTLRCLSFLATSSIHWSNRNEQMFAKSLVWQYRLLFDEKWGDAPGIAIEQMTPFRVNSLSSIVSTTLFILVI